VEKTSPGYFSTLPIVQKWEIQVSKELHLFPEMIPYRFGRRCEFSGRLTRDGKSLNSRERAQVRVVVPGGGGWEKETGVRKRLRTGVADYQAALALQLSATRDKRITPSVGAARAPNRLRNYVWRRRLTCRPPAMWSTFAERLGRFLRRGPPVGARNGMRRSINYSHPVQNVTVSLAHHPATVLKFKSHF